MSVEQRRYLAAISDEAASVRGQQVEQETLEIRSTARIITCGLRFNGADGYPLFAYLSMPREGGPFMPLFQLPPYGSVVQVPARERAARYAVMSLCHRGQRLSDAGGYKAAYPGLLTDGLPASDTYVWRSIVADCLIALDVLAARPEVDASRLAVAGNDIGALVAALRAEVRSLLVVTPLLFAAGPERAAQSSAYPLQEFNDFRRTRPEQWDEAERTLALFDPTGVAAEIGANTMIACTSPELGAAERLAGAIGGDATVSVNTGRGYVDHGAQEDWLADACGVERSKGPFLPR